MLEAPVVKSCEYRKGQGYTKIRVKATDMMSVARTCRAAYLPYRVKARRRGCVGVRTGTSVVLIIVNKPTTDRRDHDGQGPDLLPERIEEVPNHGADFVTRPKALQQCGCGQNCP